MTQIYAYLTLINADSICDYLRLICENLRLKYLFICIILSFSLISTAVFSASEPLEEQRMSLNLRNIEITEALKFFLMKARMNIVPTQKVSGRVTLTVENVPVKDLFDIMLRSNSLAYAKVGEIYNVMTEDEYRILFGRKFSDTRKVKVFHLKNAIPQKAFELLDTIKSDIGRILVDSDSGAVLIMDTPENIEKAENTLEALEQKSVIKMFNLKYANAAELEEQLKSHLDFKKVGMVRSDSRTNQLIVQTLPDRMKDIEDLVSGLDKKTKAVLIDAKIINLKLTDELTTGIDWEGLFNLGKQFGMFYLGSYPFSAVQSASITDWASREQFLKNTMQGSVGAYPFSGTVTNVSGFAGSKKIAPGEKLHIGVVDRRRDFDAMIKYLQTLGKTKIISNPTLSVINNQEAKIHIGERRAYVTTTTTLGTATKTVSEEVTYIEVGVKLSVTPTINADGYVTLRVKPEISNIIGNVTSTEGNLIPIVDTSVADTTVIAKDGSTVIIGGLGKEERTENAKQTPILNKIPILGFFAKSKSKKVERTELLIMLTPIITEGDALVTAKDKEDELYGLKSVKKFDVFEAEPSEEEAPVVEANEYKPPGPKGFKGYDSKEEIEADSSEEIPVIPRELDSKVGVSIPAKEEPFMLKEFKRY